MSTHTTPTSSCALDAAAGEYSAIVTALGGTVIPLPPFGKSSLMKARSRPRFRAVVIDPATPSRSIVSTASRGTATEGATSHG
jgi:hypothetical protein